MNDWPVGFSTGCFYQTSIFSCLEPIARHGFGMIEVSASSRHFRYHDATSVKEVASMLAALRLEAYSLHAPFSGDLDGTSLVAAERKIASEEHLAAAEAAAAIGARYLVVHPGPVRDPGPDPAERQQRMKNGAAFVDGICARCGRLGIGVALENMLPNLLFGTPRELLWLLGAIWYGNVGVCFDTGHASLSGAMEHSLDALARAAVMIHGNDNTGAADEHLPPGEGDLAWRAIFAGLGAGGFTGGIILETMKAQGETIEAALDRAARSRRFVRIASRGAVHPRPIAPAARGPGKGSRR